ncbi:DEAD/DEAH box helicase [Pedobacter sp. JY14-1]|uniref:DEAD/DEAH box helicase n=1 Tax=Pedobacter sp. JY14-1 TaxID=3034151 RepID=UPI0023E12000|nr:DEAD/DEAH box helicase [Pedobacter sp. JY14-1]
MQQTGDKEGTASVQLDLSRLKHTLDSDAGKITGKLPDDTARTVLIISQHRFYRNLVLELATVELTRSGKPKNPVRILDPLDKVWKTGDQAEIKFYTGVSRFRNNYSEERSASDLEALKAVANNPLKLDVYLHDDKVASSITAASLVPAQLSLLKPELSLVVNERGDHFEISGKISLDGRQYGLEHIRLKFQCFIQLGNQLYLVGNPYVQEIIGFFKHYSDTLVLGREAYESFRENVLQKVEEKIRISYSYLRPATPKQIKEQGFDLENEQLVYLSASEDFVLITPVMRYGNLEIPVISKKQIRTKDKNGKFFSLERDEDRELQFITTIARTHPYFMEQVAEFPDQKHADCFYLHRKRFLEEDWFLEAFSVWRSKGIAILGFNTLNNNKINQYKAEIDISVISGIDWFETGIKVRFGNQTASMKHLHRSIRNKSKFVQLDDGTQGIIPAEWLEKFEGYFGAGELIEERLITSLINYSAVQELYDEEQMDAQTRERISFYRSGLASFEAIPDVAPPEMLHAKLRHYQQQGLNWLAFLDRLNFGACLADDMGLGKTLQVLAFLLYQRKKTSQNANLVVVPASLVFNWQQEVLKFAPDLKLMVFHGAAREKTPDFSAYELILTTYGTLLSDIRQLKGFVFNYVVLDESQAIKNPGSQRYKAARMLQARNRIILTGTPVENNTYDLYGQLSFACPGLLGSREQFKQLYSVPIDQFKDSKRMRELQQRINPFILRRTKQQVATELPDKTEMVIYCEMGPRQREVYDSCRNEIREFLMNHTEDELKTSTMHVLKGITRLRQICNSTALLGSEKYYGKASSKMDVLMEEISAKASQHKILVFSQFVTMLDLISHELSKINIAHVTLTGQTRDRAKVVSDFQTDPAIRVFLISLKAGGTGLNLTEADYVYLVDPWWNPAVENQAIDRAYRIGQQKHVIAVRLICPDTIEDKIVGMQGFKTTLADDLVKVEKSIFKSLNKNELLELF